MSRLPVIFVDTSILPPEAFAYRDDEFYSLIDLLAGPDEVELLKIQSIRTVHSFLRIANVFDVLDIDSEEINRIKHHICFILKDNTYIIKAGIKGSIEYLRDIFLRKQIELSKISKKNSSNSQRSTAIMVLTNDSDSQRSTERITSIDTTDARLLIVQAMEEWCFKNGRGLNLPNLKLVEGSDFSLNIPSNTNEFARIRCGCRVSATLSRQGDKFQLSNYYRHLKSGKCSMLKSKHSNNTDDHPDNTNDSVENSMDMEITDASSHSTMSLRSKQTTSASNRVNTKRKRLKNSFDDTDID